MAFVARDKLLEVCQMMALGRGLTPLEGQQHTKTLVLVDRGGNQIASLRGHIGRGGKEEVPMGSALQVIKQMADGNPSAYEAGKWLVTDPEFRRVKPLQRVEIRKYIKPPGFQPGQSATGQERPRDQL